MRFTAAVFSGLIGGTAFTVGWIWDPAQPAVLTTSLVCGLAAIFGQMSTRDLLARAMSLAERGADEVLVDGGEMVVEAEGMRKRIADLAIATQVIGVLAPTAATLRQMLPNQGLSGASFAFGFIALFLSYRLYAANTCLAGLVIEERRRRAIRKTQKEALEKAQAPAASILHEGNMKGFGLISTSE
jgi:hypothetical protein